MKQWFTTGELAELGLNGLPGSKIGIHRRIARENWAAYTALARKREGSAGGGGFEYHLDQLPMISRLDYLARQVVVDVKDIAENRPEFTDCETASATEMTERDARLAIVAIADRFKRDSGYSTAGADDWFCRLIKSGSLNLPEWIAEIITSLSARSIARWRAARNKNNAETLAFDRSQSRKGTGILDRAHDGEVRNHILAHLANNPHLSSKHIRLAVKGEFGDVLDVQGRQVSLPPLRTFQNTICVWKNTYRNELMRLSDPDGYKSKVRYAVTGTTFADRLNEIWEIDASPLDMMCTDGRVNIYVAVDIFSRRMVIHMTKTPRAIGVGELIRKCIKAWGIPEWIHTDNGSDFKANATQRLLAALSIDVHYCDAYSPEQKGVVERSIKTFQHDLPVISPGFIGHNVADRKRIEGQRSFANRLGMDDDKIFKVEKSMVEMQELADFWAEKVYGENKHGGINAKPNEKAASAEGTVRRLAHPEALDILLAPLVGSNGMRKVTKSGIRANNEHYLIGTVMPGASVFCRFDPADAGRIYVFAPDGQTFLGHALNWKLAGIPPAELAHRVRAQQKTIEDEAITDIRAARRRIKPMDIVDAMRAEAIENQPNLIAFPKPETHIETPQSAAASDASYNPPSGSSLQSGGGSGVGSEATIGGLNKVVRLADRETDRERFNRARSMRARIENGEIVKDSDRHWLAGYEAGPEYSSLKQMVEDFGEENVI